MNTEELKILQELLARVAFSADPGRAACGLTIGVQGLISERLGWSLDVADMHRKRGTAHDYNERLAAAYRGLTLALGEPDGDNRTTLELCRLIAPDVK